jgi:hypothetical protein
MLRRESVTRLCACQVALLDWGNLLICLSRRLLPFDAMARLDAMTRLVAPDSRFEDNPGLYSILYLQAHAVCWSLGS